MDLDFFRIPAGRFYLAVRVENGVFKQLQAEKSAMFIIDDNFS